MVGSYNALSIICCSCAVDAQLRLVAFVLAFILTLRRMANAAAIVLEHLLAQTRLVAG